MICWSIGSTVVKSDVSVPVVLAAVLVVRVVAVSSKLVAIEGGLV